MSQTRGRAVLDYSKLLLESVLQDKGEDHLDSTRTPAINKENNSTQGSQMRNELLSGQASPDASGHQSAPRARHVALAPDRGSGVDSRFGAALTSAHPSEESAEAAGALSQGVGGALGAQGASALYPDEGAMPDLSNGNDTRFTSGVAARTSPWSKRVDVDGAITFTSPHEPQGSVIPRDTTLRKDYENGQYTQVRFLESFDMALGQAEGEGGDAVVHNVLRFVKLKSLTSVDTGEKLLVPMEVTFRARAFDEIMADERLVELARGGVCVEDCVCAHTHITRSRSCLRA